MPGMKVTLNSAMRVRDVSKPLPHHDEQALAKVADWPAARPRPASPPASRGNKPGTAPGPWRPGPERSEAPSAQTGSGHRKGQARPAPQGPGGTGQRPQPPASGGLGQLPQPGVTQPPRQPPAIPASDDVVSGPRPGAGRRKRVRRRRRGGQAGG
jgi:hypothetical protein